MAKDQIKDYTSIIDSLSKEIWNSYLELREANPAIPQKPYNEGMLRELAKSSLQSIINQD